MLSQGQIFQLVVSGRMFCWAGQGDRHSIEPTIPGAKRFRLETNYNGIPASYEDQYLGENAFFGSELVRVGDENEAVWGMNYNGYLMDEVEKVEQFLKSILRTEANRIRFGEDVHITQKDLTYSSRTVRRVNNLHFTQIETIKRAGVEFYSATLSAGSIMTLP
ncbi:MAG: DUF5680 domain-containing protein [Nanoarchaeota archaeon]